VGRASLVGFDNSNVIPKRNGYPTKDFENLERDSLKNWDLNSGAVHIEAYPTITHSTSNLMSLSL